MYFTQSQHGSPPSSLRREPCSVGGHRPVERHIDKWDEAKPWGVQLWESGSWIASIYAMEWLLRVWVCIVELHEKEGTSVHFHSVRMKAYWPVFWLNSSDCFQNNLFLSNSCASGQLRSDEMTMSLYANYWTNFLPIFTMCPVTPLMNILDICMNNQTAHRRADCLFVRLEMLWRWYCNSVCPCESNIDRRKGSYSGLFLSIHRCPEIGCQISL